MLYSMRPDFIAFLKIFPPDCSEWRLWSGNTPPYTPHLLGLRMEECSRLWKKTSFQLHTLHPPKSPCWFALYQSRTANPRHLLRWDVFFSVHTSYTFAFLQFLKLVSWCIQGLTSTSLMAKHSEVPNKGTSSLRVIYRIHPSCPSLNEFRPENITTTIILKILI